MKLNVDKLLNFINSY